MRWPCSPFAEKPANLELLHSLGVAYGCRPSAVMGVREPWAAFQLDVSCLLAGRTAEREAAEGKRGPQKTLGPQKFRDPTPFVTQKMKIPESGVW